MSRFTSPVGGKNIISQNNVMEAAVNLEAVDLHKNPGCEKCKPILPNDLDGDVLD